MDINYIFRYVTRDGADPEGLPGVFFTCHPGDFSRYFDDVCSLLFDAMDCAVFYTEDQNEDLSGRETEEFLREMRSFVIPLSGELLEDGARALEHDMTFAVDNGISVLPLILDEGLDRRYSIADCIGGIPYIDATVNYDPDYDLNDRIFRYLADRNDPGILQQYHVMAELFMMKGRNDWAEDTLKWVIDNRKRLLGVDSPDTLRSMNRLADLYEETGRELEASGIREEVCWQLLGKVPGTDPAILTKLSNMAVWLDEENERARALEIKKKVLEERERILGLDDPDTAVSMSNLAYSYGQMGEYEKKLDLEERTYEIQKRTLGGDDPSTLITLSNMAYSHLMMGDAEKACELYRIVLDARRRILGPENEKTLSTQRDLEYALRQAGRCS